VSGTVAIAADITDNAIAGARWTILDADDQYTEHLGYTQVPQRPVNGTARVQWLLDTTQHANGEARVWVEGLDYVSSSGFGNQYVRLNIQNGGAPTTTSTSSSTSTSAPGNTTSTSRPPGAVAVAVLTAPQTATAGVETALDLCRSTGGPLDAFYYVSGGVALLCPAAGTSTTDPRCRLGPQGLCHAAWTFATPGTATVLAYVRQAGSVQWSEQVRATVTVTAGPVTTSLPPPNSTSSTSSSTSTSSSSSSTTTTSRPSTTAPPSTSSTSSSTTVRPTTTTRPPTTTSTVPGCGMEGRTCRNHRDCQQGPACADYRCGRRWFVFGGKRCGR
jgi:hypothetical protein